MATPLPLLPTKSNPARRATLVRRLRLLPGTPGGSQ